MHPFDDRRLIFTAPDKHSAEEFAAIHWVSCAIEAIQRRGAFFVALSGGSTPHAIFQALSSNVFRKTVSWRDVHLFWSDERSVPPDHPDSNYKMAMDSGLDSLPIPKEHIHRMHAEKGEPAANEYQKTILKLVPNGIFDLVMLGMGDDGHTASLFPHTKALHEDIKLVTMNFIPSKDTQRMTLTYPCINKSTQIVLYVLGESKAPMVAKVLNGPYEPDTYPVQRIGTKTNKALWVMDKNASKLLK